MFICQLCGKQTKPGEPSNLIIIEKRDKIYEYTVKKDREEVKRTSRGWEIVKEKRVCEECDEKSRKNQESVKIN